jgi:NADH dehydrogenase
MAVTTTTAATEQRTDVLVLGGGFAGVWCAQRLEKLLPKSATITLVSTDNYFEFQPLLPEVVGGSLEPSHVISPLRHLLRRTHVVRGTIEAIDAGNLTVGVRVPDLDQPLRLRGTHTVLALGSIVDVSRIPGMAEHAFMMKRLADALRLRQAIVDRLDRATLTEDADLQRSLLTFVVVGGGFSGVETAAEVLDLVANARRFYPRLEGVASRVICIHSGDELLPELDPRLGRFARENLTKRGMDVRMAQRVRAVSGDAVYLADGSTIATKTIVCTIGNAPHPVLQPLGLPSERGRIVTDECLRVADRPGLWAIGDCALTPDGHGGKAAPTAQFAVRQGVVAAENIARTIARKAPRPFKHRSLGQLATLGHQTAVALVGKLRISGFLAWWLWRTIYLAKLPRFVRKLQVVVDWTLRLLFPRDIDSIDVSSKRVVAHAHLERDEVLFRQGDPAAAFYVIEQGAMELVQRDDDGQTVLVERLGPGDHFGEGSLLRSRSRRTTATAAEPTKLLVVSAPLFDELVCSWSHLRLGLESTSRRFTAAKDILPRGVPEQVLDLTCEQLMKTPVLTLPGAASLADAMRMFGERPVSCLPLVDGEGRLVGLATRTDLYRSLHRDCGLTTPITELCSRDVHTVTTGESVRRALEVLRRRGIKHVPVLDADGRVVGMISFRDVLRQAIAVRDAADASSAIGAGAGASR